MKNIFFFLALSLTLFACSKDEDSDNTPAPGTATPLLKFAVDGTTGFEWTYRYQQTPTKTIGLVKNSAGEYSLWAESDGEKLRLGLPTRLLVEKSYNYIQGTSTGANGTTEVWLSAVDPNNTYAASNRGDAVSFEVTQINNGLASGTFQAQLSVPGTPSKKIQVSGLFTNIEIRE